jgi:hypothetical protein
MRADIVQWRRAIRCADCGHVEMPARDEGDADGVRWTYGCCPACGDIEFSPGVARGRIVQYSDALPHCWAADADTFVSDNTKRDAPAAVEPDARSWAIMYARHVDGLTWHDMSERSRVQVATLRALYKRGLDRLVFSKAPHGVRELVDRLLAVDKTKEDTPADY